MTQVLRRSAVSSAARPERITNFARSSALRARAQALIPAGAHTYSKGNDQFPELAPGFIVRGQGSHCWDVDGNEFVDWGMGLRAVVLGHAYPAVNDAVMRQLQLGANFTRPSPIELELAELLVEIVPCAEMVKLAKNGSDVTSAAVRLARAYTGRDMVARCRQSAFHSFYDWFIGSTVVDAGVPKAVRDLTVQFGYNDVGELRELFERYPGQIAAVIMEPTYGDAPLPGYLGAVKALTHEHGAVFILDEVITGFRWHLAGGQAFYGVTPDLACFGKGLGNGFSVSALVGRRDIMELGGLGHDKERVFLLSSTHGGETHAIAAGIATVEEMRERNVIEHLWRTGQALMDGFNGIARDQGLADLLRMEGYPPYPRIVCRDHAGNDSLAFRTLFLQEMIAHGVLIPHVAVAYTHTDAEIDHTLEAARRAMGVYRAAIERRDVLPDLVGPAVKPVFRRFN